MGLRKIEPGMVVHCQTEEEARVLMEWAYKCGYEWMDGKPKEYTAFAAFEKYTCYNFHEARKISYAEKAYFEKYKKEEVIEYSDIILPELTAKEVLDTIHEICAGHNRCDGECSIYNACPMRALCSKEWDSAEEIIETFQKIAAYEKKEPEKESRIETVSVWLTDGYHTAKEIRIPDGSNAPWGNTDMEGKEEKCADSKAGSY